MTPFPPCVLGLFLLTLPLAPQESKDKKEPVIETSKAEPGGRGLGTKGYGPTDTEKPFLKKVTEKPVNLWADVKMPKPDNMTDEEWAKEQKEREKQKEKDKDKIIPVEKYRLADQAGEYVAWFGIVREASWDPKTRKTTLVVEHKYFDGMVDLHQQIVSYYGAGDFTATVAREKTGIPSLALVRIYGKVAKEKDKEGRAVVAAEYLRVWDWGLFAFMDYGKDKSNEKWIKLRKVEGKDAYDSRPTTEYYEARLGKRDSK